ncbi:MAG: hypothetical protein ACI9CZ_001645, partial [Flavobacterium sp.]
AQLSIFLAQIEIQYLKILTFLNQTAHLNPLLSLSSKTRINSNGI